MPARRIEVIEEVLNVRGFQAGRDPVPFQDFPHTGTSATQTTISNRPRPTCSSTRNDAPRRERIAATNTFVSRTTHGTLMAVL